MATPFTAGQKVRASELNGLLTPGAWQIPTLGLSRANLGSGFVPVRYRLLTVLNAIQVQGTLAAGAGAGTLFTLPVGFRPANSHVFGGQHGTNASLEVYALNTGAFTVPATTSFLAWNEIIPLD